MDRNHEIDGLRGWAALVVIFFHFFAEIFGRMFPYLHSPYLNFVLNGHLMVLVFFILSGDALSYSFFRDKDIRATARIATARYFRLALPILISCMLVWLSMRTMITHNLDAASVVHREDWLGNFIDFAPSFTGALKYSLNGVFFHHALKTSYNPFLWPMAIELMGSLLVFVNVLILSRHRSPLVVLCVEAVYFFVFSEFYFLFVLGMIFGYLRSRGTFARLRALKANWLFLAAFLFIGLIVFTFWKQPLQSLFTRVTFDRINVESLNFLWAGLIVFVVYSSASLARFFGNALSRFLGEISFPLYVFQFNVLVTFTSFLIVVTDASGRLNGRTYWIIALSSIAVTVVVAWAFRFFEKKYLSFVNGKIRTAMVEE